MKLLQPVGSERDSQRERERETDRKREKWGILKSFDPARNTLLLCYSAHARACAFV